MALLSNVLTLIGLLFLSHAIYSAYEHVTTPLPSSHAPAFNATSTRSSSASSSPNTPEFSLPLDIQLEAIISTALLTLAIILSARAPGAGLRPIQWRAWAGRIEREGWEPTEGAVAAGGRGDGGRGNPYIVLERRKGFWDIRSARRGFAEWVREGGAKAAKA